MFPAPAAVHTQSESRDFSGTSKWREILRRFNGAFALLQPLAVELSVRPVPGPRPSHITRRARAESIKISAAPIIDVVTAGAVGNVAVARTRRNGLFNAAAGEIGNLVLLETGSGGALQQ